MERSREALFLRLEQMKINSHSQSHQEIEPVEEITASKSSPRAKTTSTDDIPIKKVNRTHAVSFQEGRGVTDDMMFFAEGECTNSVDSTNEPFIPPHLQRNDSLLAHSYV